MGDSIVREYSCQYTDQIRKKHKTWQDGKLKYFSTNNKFTLYSDPDSTLLSSGYVTNSKELGIVLDPAGFGRTEHKVFGRYVIIIEDLLTEYGGKTTSRAKMNPQKPESKLPIRKVVIKSNVPETTSGALSTSLLTLKFNKQYTKPKPLRKDAIKAKQILKVDEQIPRTEKHIPNNNKVIYSKDSARPQTLQAGTEEKITSLDKQHIDKNSKVNRPNHVEKPDSLRRSRKISKNNHKIEHKPINIL